ncbi:MAG: bifunctional glutamate N-acetyltransferase/amino-acid acetyltransferase ArgJ [Actinomycetota bacterium]
MIAVKSVKGGVTAPLGFKAAGVVCGIKKSGLPDMAVVVADPPAKAGCMFTTNAVKAAPVVVSMENCGEKHIAAIIINSGNANACTGDKGLSDAREMCAQAADIVGVKENKILVASTGIIGIPLPMEAVKKGIKAAMAKATVKGGAAAAKAIMTTDKQPKEAAVEVAIGKKTVRIGGMAKGAGMIAPNMATMIAVITTDADICAKALDQSVREAVDVSFHCISIDGDMSTNDTVNVLANGAAGNTHILQNTSGHELFTAGLTEVMFKLAEMMVRDGEAATKFVKIAVDGAGCQADAKAVAMAIADSLLVKCALFGEDANWGRIAAAAGAAGVDFDPRRLEISLDSEPIMRGGEGVVFCVETIKKIMKSGDIEINLNLNAGQDRATVLTTDLSVGYVKFNAHYRT